MRETCKVLFLGWRLADWRAAYQGGVLQPGNLFELLELREDDPAWITRLDKLRLDAQVEELAERSARAGGPEHLPLYGVPFAVKDNIDVAGWPTTAACAEFAYVAAEDAAVVRRLREAGAIIVGKTNLDQFATGLVGTRSPYGVVPNSFRPEYISGGSSSGSASVVARGLVPFALGTDTAGSGRVPAGLNNIVGMKPTRGWLSTHGVVPACRTLDCVSILALTVDDAELVATIAGAFDEADAYSRTEAATGPVGFADRPRFAVPLAPEFFGDTEAELAFARALEHARTMGAEIVPIDFTPFSELAGLLYQGPWVAERFAAVEQLWQRQSEAIHPVVRGIVEEAANYSAADAFRAEYRRASLARVINGIMATVDALLVPTAPTVYTIEEVLADPLTLNAKLGTYTNFANFADLCALALPAGMRNDGLPVGITLLASAWHDRALAAFGRRWQSHLAQASEGLTLGATGCRYPLHASQTSAQARHTVRLAVVGAHLQGMPLNHQLTSRGAAFIEATHTAAEYRLYALAGSTPAKPGLVRVSPQEPGASAIAVELWDVPIGHFGAFVTEIPAPLGIGSLLLADGRVVKGFICEPCGLEGAKDITAFGGWRAYLASLQ